MGHHSGFHFSKSKFIDTESSWMVAYGRGGRKGKMGIDCWLGEGVCSKIRLWWLLCNPIWIGFKKINL